MGKMKERISQFAWELHDQRRAALSVSLGAVAGVIGWKWLGLGGKVAFLAGWILALTIYLVLLGTVIFQADGAMTRQRVSRHPAHAQRDRWTLLRMPAALREVPRLVRPGKGRHSPHIGTALKGCRAKRHFMS